jgi:hypothetical protein
MSPHYDRRSDFSASAVAQCQSNAAPEDAAIEDAAKAIRAAEIEAVQPGISREDWSRLESLSIDELRKLAAELDVPDRALITEQDELIAAIRKRL